MGQYLISGLLNGITETWSAITGFFSEKLGPLKDSIVKGWESIKTETKKKWDDISTTIGSTWDSIKTTTSTKWESLKSDVTSKWNRLKGDLEKTDWKDVGTNLVSGLKSGISNAWNSLKSTVSSLAQGLTNKVMDVFDMNSPSKIWAEIGEYLDAGLEQGIDAGKKSALSTVTDLAKSVNGKMQLDTPEIADMKFGNFSGIDLVASKFDGLIDKLKVITDMLTSIGGLSVPSVAAGTDVPYRLRTYSVDSSDTAGGISGGLQTVMSDQTEIMSEVMYLLGQILDVIKKFHLKIDADSLVNVISYIQRSNERNYGGV